MQLSPWPWYVVGPLIALTMAALLLSGRRFGISSNLRTMCTVAGAGSLSEYFRLDWRAQGGQPLDIHRYGADRWTSYLLGGTVFGMGWTVTGACPGPLFITLGAGYWSIVVAILGALLGTLLYGILRSKLPL